MDPVFPPIVSGRDVDVTGTYACPLCKVQSTGDIHDIGWVYCPMVKGKAICLGDCIDFQSIVTSIDLEDHIYKDDIYKLAKIMRKDVVQLRLRCLRHQREVLQAKMERYIHDDEKLSGLKTLDATLETLIEAIS